ncbi:MAG: helix-turn-helix domain-containing protein [Acetatifactor sp.]
MNIGQKLFQLRTSRGVYQKDLAEYLEVSVGTISNYENGVHSPDLNTLCRLAEYFQVSTDYLLQLTDNSDSMQDLNQQLSQEYTVGKALNVIQGLSDPGIHGMVKYISMVKACEKIPEQVEVINRQKKIIEQQAEEISRLKEQMGHPEQKL